MSCTCSSGVGDTGLTSCLPMNEITSGLLFQQTYTSAGARNNLAGSSIGTAAYLTGLTQNADETVRIMPLQNLVEVVDERGETTFYTDDTGVNHELKEGERVFNGEIIINASPQLYGELNKFKCIQMSVYNVGDKGGIFGDSDTVSELEGFEIVKGSMSFNFMKKTPAKPAHIKVQFTYADTVDDANLYKYDVTEIEDSAKTLSGLITVNGTVNGTVTASAFTVNLAAIYGSAKTRIAIEDLVVADFTLTETSPTPGATTITTVVESAVVAGQYLFTVTTTSADVNELTLSATGLGKGYRMNSLTITTP